MQVRHLMKSSFAAAAAAFVGLSQAASPASDASAAGNSVRALCTKVDQQLNDALNGRATTAPLPATLHVSMRVEGSQVSTLRITGGELDQRRAVRRAIHELTCDAGTAGAQDVVFDVVFADPDASRAPSASPQRG